MSDPFPRESVARPDGPDGPAALLAEASGLVDDTLAGVLRDELANERHGGVSPATVDSTHDSVRSGLLHDRPAGVEQHVLDLLEAISNLVGGHAPVEDLL